MSISNGTRVRVKEDMEIGQSPSFWTVPAGTVGRWYNNCRIVFDEPIIVGDRTFHEAYCGHNRVEPI